MKDSTMKHVAMPTSLRANRRTWLTVTGKVVADAPDAPPADKLTEISWEAEVIDTATETRVESYPVIESNSTVSEHADVTAKLQHTYINMCHLRDNEKLDVELLTNNVNAGVWAINVILLTPEAT